MCWFDEKDACKLNVMSERNIDRKRLQGITVFGIRYFYFSNYNQNTLIASRYYHLEKEKN